LRQPSVPSRREFLAAALGAFAAGCAPGSDWVRSPRESGIAEVNGTRLYYETAGSGEPVVLLHAFMLDTRMWDPQFEVLAGSFRVIAYDARGFGRSAVPVPGEPYSHADDLAALLASLGARRPHVVGLSMGARFALDYAVARPGELGSLTVINAVIGGWQWSPEWLTSYAPIVEAGRRGDIAGAKQLWLAHPMFAPAREKPEVAARLKAMVDDYSGWHLNHRNPERPPSPPTVTQLARIRVPTLVLIGDRDLPDFQRMAQSVAQDVAGARRVKVPAAGHLANMETPAAVNAALREFLARG